MYKNSGGGMYGEVGTWKAGEEMGGNEGGDTMADV